MAAVTSGKKLETKQSSSPDILLTDSPPGVSKGLNRVALNLSHVVTLFLDFL